MSQTCRFHCAHCGRCFASLAAFDWHREPIPDAYAWDYDLCRDPRDVMEGEYGRRRPYEARPGVCALRGGERVQAVVWADHTSRIRFQRRFRSARGRVAPETPREGEQMPQHSSRSEGLRSGRHVPGAADG